MVKAPSIAVFDILHRRRCRAGFGLDHGGRWLTAAKVAAMVPLSLREIGEARISATFWQAASRFLLDTVLIVIFFMHFLFDRMQLRMHAVKVVQYKCGLLEFVIPIAERGHGAIVAVYAAHASDSKIHRSCLPLIAAA